MKQLIKSVNGGLNPLILQFFFDLIEIDGAALTTAGGAAGVGSEALIEHPSDVDHG